MFDAPAPAPIATRSRWQAWLVAAGKSRARAAIVGFSVVASVLLVVAMMVALNPPREQWAFWLLPAVIVPLVVSPLASYLVLELAFELDAATARGLQHERQLAALFEHAPIGIARLDGDGTVRSANPRMRALIGEIEADSMPVWSRVFVSADALRAFRDALQAAHPIEAAHWQWYDPHRHERTVRVALVPMPVGASSSGEAGADSVLLAEDITEREAVEAHSLKAQKLELVGQIAGGLAHDFNNLLTVVRGSVAVLGGRDGAPELRAIDDAAASGARITRRLLAISRHDLLTLVPHAPGPVLLEAVELMRRVLPTRIRIVSPEHVPDVTLALDRDAVQQALLNLAVNARDAIVGSGTIHLDVRTDARDGQEMLVVTVADDGYGMTEIVRARALEPFFTTKQVDGGTGLGLAMVHGMMQRHAGCVSLESAPGAGTRVELWFPVLARVPASLPARVEGDVGTAPTTSAGEPPATAPVAQLLVVEDERAVRLVTERTLQALGYAVTGAADMTAALAHVATGAPIDVIVSDVMMPGGTGVDLVHALRAAGNAVPVLLVSGYASEDLEALRVRDGHVEVLGKPWTQDALGAKVDGLLAGARVR